MVAENQPDNNEDLPNDQDTTSNSASSVVEWLKTHKLILMYLVILITSVLVIVFFPSQKEEKENFPAFPTPWPY